MQKLIKFRRINFCRLVFLKCFADSRVINFLPEQTFTEVGQIRTYLKKYTTIIINTQLHKHIQCIFQQW